MKISAEGHRRALKSYLADGAVLGAFLLWYLWGVDEGAGYATFAGAISAISVVALANLGALSTGRARALSAALALPYGAMSLAAMLALLAPTSPDWEGGRVEGVVEALHWLGAALSVVNGVVLLSFLREIWARIEPPQSSH